MKADFTLDQGLGIRVNLTINSKEKRDFVLDAGSNLSMIYDDSLPKKSFHFHDKKEEVSLTLPNESSLGMFSFYLFDTSNAGLQGILGFDFLDFIWCVLNGLKMDHNLSAA
ncbi:MAG: hypothetical protein LBC45_02335 [Chlamydiales bacterium]|jgi:hypothetical protein|nr:hypothetical protein [Chlamydiales bacterium]